MISAIQPGRLHVSLAGEAANIAVEHLPFEVREVREDRPSVSVARGTLGGTVDLAPGSYVVTAVAPEGDVLMTPSAVDVQSDQTTEARLEQWAVRADALHPSAAIVQLPKTPNVLAESVAALSQYMSRGDFSEAASMSSAILAAYAGSSDRRVKPPRKLAALFACYVLLRQNQLEPLRGFVERLAVDWPNSPDAVAIRIETYARVGLHEKAANLCTCAPSLGVPTVASGIAYMQQRMRQYIEAARPQEDEELLPNLAFLRRPDFAAQLESAFTVVARAGSRLDSSMLVTAARVRGPYLDY